MISQAQAPATGSCPGCPGTCRELPGLLCVPEMVLKKARK